MAQQNRGGRPKGKRPPIDVPTTFREGIPVYSDADGHFANGTNTLSNQDHPPGIWTVFGYNQDEEEIAYHIHSEFDRNLLSCDLLSRADDDEQVVAAKWMARLGILPILRSDGKVVPPPTPRERVSGSYIVEGVGGGDSAPRLLMPNKDISGNLGSYVLKGKVVRYRPPPTLSPTAGMGWKSVAFNIACALLEVMFELTFCERIAMPNEKQYLDTKSFYESKFGPGSWPKRMHDRFHKPGLAGEAVEEVFDPAEACKDYNPLMLNPDEVLFYLPMLYVTKAATYKAQVVLAIFGVPMRRKPGSALRWEVFLRGDFGTSIAAASRDEPHNVPGTAGDLYRAVHEPKEEEISLFDKVKFAVLSENSDSADIHENKQYLESFPTVPTPITNTSVISDKPESISGQIYTLAQGLTKDAIQARSSSKKRRMGVDAENFLMRCVGLIPCAWNGSRYTYTKRASTRKAGKYQTSKAQLEKAALCEDNWKTYENSLAEILKAQGVENIPEASTLAEMSKEADAEEATYSEYSPIGECYRQHVVKLAASDLRSITMKKPRQDSPSSDEDDE